VSEAAKAVADASAGRFTLRPVDPDAPPYVMPESFRRGLSDALRRAIHNDPPGVRFVFRGGES
jgi:hypothetical protein